LLLLKDRRFDLDKIQFIVVDIDGTLWDQYDADADEVKELAAFGRILNLSGPELGELITQEKKRLRTTRGRKFSMYEVLLLLGVKPHDMTAIRCQIYQPQATVNQALVGLVRDLSLNYHAVFGTNSPVPIGQQVINLLGLRQVVDEQKSPVWGFENLNCFKPNPLFFARICNRMNWCADLCLSIGDSKHKDGLAALTAGFNAGIIVENPSDICSLIPLLINRDWEIIKSFPCVVSSLEYR